MKTKILVVWLCLASAVYAAQKREASAPKSAAETIDAKLIACVKTGDAACVAQTLAAGATANAVDEQGVAALILAAEGKSAEVVRLLLDAGADVNGARAGEGTPLCRAALFGRKEIADALLAKKAKVNVVCDSDHGDTPLMDALRGMMLAEMPGELREGLVRESVGSDESTGDSEANSSAANSLEANSSEGNSSEANSQNVATASTDKLREFLDVSRDNFLGVARSLLAHGADVNVVAKCDVGESALMHAAMGANVEMVRELLARGADANRGVPLLAWLLQYERELERGKNLALPALSTQQTAMLEWSEKTRAAREEIKRLLKASGAKESTDEDESEDASANAETQEAETLEEVANEALRDVIEKDDRKDFARLVDAYAKHPLGAVVLPEALRKTIIYQRTEMFKLLLERGTSPNADRGMASRHPPLQQAAFSGQLEYVRLLLDAGADVEKRDENGLTALDAAERQASSSEEHRAVAELLKARAAKSKGRKP